MSPGRNDPCPCGSGKKYKKCCGDGRPDFPVAADPQAQQATALKRTDRALAERLLRFAKMRGGVEWLGDAMADYLGTDDAVLEDPEMQLAIPWALFHYDGADGTPPMATLLREERGARLSPELQELLDAQLDAWMSVWEVQDVTPGTGMTLKDLLTGEQRFVYEVLGSKGLVVRDAVMGRIITCNGVSFLAGLHPRALSPYDADVVVREMRRACRVRTRPVRTEKLRDVEIQHVLIDWWRAAVAQADLPKPMPTMQNTDGDPISPTTDHFAFAEADARDVIAKLARMPGAEEPVREHGATEITITKPGNATHTEWNNTVIGRAVIKGTRLTVESNSTNRGDRLRQLVQSELGSLVQHRLRDESSLESLLSRERTAPPGGPHRTPEVMPPEFKAIARTLKEQHMVRWVDENIPALGGLTPRAAAKSPKSRAKLDLLLRDFERREAQLPADERFDLVRLRTTLGFDAG